MDTREHDSPYFDERVRFPEVRINYDSDGRWEVEDIEVTTVHYRDGHGPAAAWSSFTCVRASSARMGGWRSADVRLAEEFV